MFRGVAHRLTSIVISRFLLNLWDYNYTCLADTAASSHLTSVQFRRSRRPGEGSASVSFSGASALESTSARMIQEEGSSFCRRLVEFVEPLSTPIGGFLWELGLGGEDGHAHEAYIFDIEELWKDISKKSECMPDGV